MFTIIIVIITFTALDEFLAIFFSWFQNPKYNVFKVRSLKTLLPAIYCLKIKRRLYLGKCILANYYRKLSKAVVMYLVCVCICDVCIVHISLVHLRWPIPLHSVKCLLL